MSRLTRDGIVEPIARVQILRREWGQGNIRFPCSAEHEQDWQPYPVDLCSAICDDHIYIYKYIVPPDVYAVHHNAIYVLLIVLSGSRRWLRLVY